MNSGAAAAGHNRVLPISAATRDNCGALMSRLSKLMPKAREKADEVFKGEMLRKMAAVEKDLEIETRNRQASEEQLVNALNDYTRALQDGLRIVNRAH